MPLEHHRSGESPHGLSDGRLVRDEAAGNEPGDQHRDYLLRGQRLHDGSVATEQSFTYNGDGTISDNLTGLILQKAEAGETTSENAVKTGGYTDWRVANQHELMSLFDYETSNPAMNATYFQASSPSAKYWCRTTYLLPSLR